MMIRAICRQISTMTDLFASMSLGKPWSWSAARPHGFCRYAAEKRMSLGIVISVYATVFKALGLFLRHPGSIANANVLNHSIATEHLEKSVVWMSATDECAEQPFNITNGDVFRWNYMWPVIADYFEMDLAQPQRIDMK